MVGQNVAWNHAGRLLEYGVVYATSILIARALGVQSNGLYATIVSVAQILVVASSLGLDASLNKHLPQMVRGDSAKRFVLLRLLLLRVALFLTVAALLSVAVYAFPGFVPSSIVAYLWILIPFAAVRSIIPLLTIALVSQFRASLNTKITVVARCAELAVVGVCAVEGATVGTILLLLSVTGGLQIVAYLLVARGDFFGESSKVILRPLIAFGGLFWLNSGVDYFLGKHGDLLLLTLLTREGTPASLYDVAYSLVQTALLATTVGFSGVSFAAFARMAATERGALERFYHSLVRMISLLCLPAFAYLLFHAGPVLDLLYTREYGPAVRLVEGMAAFRIFSRLFAGGENAEYLLSIGKVSQLVGIGVIAAVINILMNLALIPAFQAGGSVLASGCANLVVNVLGYILVRRYGPVRLQVGYWAKLTFIFCMSSAAVRLLGDALAVQTPLMSLPAFLLLCIALVGITKPVHAGDLEFVSGLGPRITGFVARFAAAA
jgi:O-antigen/teichoic acid export membrane protein